MYIYIFMYLSHYARRDPSIIRIITLASPTERIYRSTLLSMSKLRRYAASYTRAPRISFILSRNAVPPSLSFSAFVYFPYLLRLIRVI